MVFSILAYNTYVTWDFGYIDDIKTIYKVVKYHGHQGTWAQ